MFGCGKDVTVTFLLPPLPLRNIRYTAVPGATQSVLGVGSVYIYTSAYLRTFLIMVQNHMVPCAKRMVYERQRICKKGPSHEMNIFCRLRQLTQ